MYKPRFCLPSFAVVDREGREVVLMMLFEALIASNVAYLRKRPETPSLYASGVRYVGESLDAEDWQDIPETIARGTGDCEDLACWRIAELRVRDGEHAHPFLKCAERNNGVLYHVAVRRFDGSLEDPSRVLGMH